MMLVNDDSSVDKVALVDEKVLVKAVLVGKP